MPDILKKVPRWSYWYLFLVTVFLLVQLDRISTVCPAEPVCMFGNAVLITGIVISGVFYSFFLLAGRSIRRIRRGAVYYGLIGISSAAVAMIAVAYLLLFRLELFLKIWANLSGY